MKNGSVRRGVQAANVSRLPGSAPDLGRVTRMPGYGRRGTRRRRNHSDAFLSQRQRQRSWQVLAWSIGIGVVSVVVLGGLSRYG